MAIHLSATSIKEFLECELKYYYRVAGVDTDTVIQSKELLLGTLTHKILEDSWDSEDKALDQLYKLSESNGLDKDDRTKIAKFVSNYFRNFASMVTSNDEIEKWFKIKLDSGVFLVGKIDRITKSGMIIDWKTTAKPPKNIDTDIQFIIYYTIYKNMLHPVNSPLATIYASLSTGSFIEFHYNDVYERVLFDQIIPDMVSKIKKSKLSATGFFNKKCYNCQYRSKCYSDFGLEE